jgi:hypothetical protein
MRFLTERFVRKAAEEIVDGEEIFQVRVWPKVFGMVAFLVWYFTS